jgi:hypothetical protein
MENGAAPRRRTAKRGKSLGVAGRTPPPPKARRSGGGEVGRRPHRRRRRHHQAARRHGLLRRRRRRRLQVLDRRRIRHGGARIGAPIAAEGLRRRRVRRRRRHRPPLRRRRLHGLRREANRRSPHAVEGGGVRTGAEIVPRAGRQVLRRRMTVVAVERKIAAAAATRCADEKAMTKVMTSTAMWTIAGGAKIKTGTTRPARFEKFRTRTRRTKRAGAADRLLHRLRPRPGRPIQGRDRRKRHQQRSDAEAATTAARGLDPTGGGRDLHRT